MRRAMCSAFFVCGLRWFPKNPCSRSNDVVLLTLLKLPALLWSPHFPAFALSPMIADNDHRGYRLSLSGKLGVLLLCLFAAPFAGFGIFALSEAIRLWSAGPVS